MPVTRTTAAVQFSLVSNAAITLNSTQSYNLQLALSGATNRIGTFLARTDRSAALTSVFGSAGTAATTFNTNVSNLLTVMSGTGLGLQVELRSAADMNGAAVAYAPSSPSGGPRIYLNVDLLSNGTSSDLISWLLLEAAGHNIDSRLNGLLDTAGDEGKAFAALLTGRTLTDSEMATYGRDPAGGVVMVNGVAVAVECEANKGPSASATALNSSFSEAAGLASQAAAVAVFSNANVSVGGANETWQRITALRFSVAGLRDGSAESVSIDGTSISLGAASSGTTSTNGFSYGVTIANGVATINLSRSNGVSAAAVNALLNGLTYQNRNADDPTAGTRTITLTSLSDSGGAVAGGTGVSNPNLSSSVNVVTVNDGPLATATATNNSFTEAAGLATQTAAVAVFTGASVNTIEAGQTILGLSFSVSGLRDGNAEILTIDGTTIALGANSIGVTTGSGLSYGVVVSNGTATINLSSATGLSASAANALLNGVSYQNTNLDNPSAGGRTITLTSLRDSGGTANGGSDTITPNLTSTITVLAVNDAPQLGSLAGVNFSDTVAADSFAASSGSLVASDPEGGTLSYGLTDAIAASTSFDGLSYDLSKSGTYGTLYLNSSNGLYRFQPKSDWNLNAINSSGTDSFNFSVSDGVNTTSSVLLVNFSGVQDAPEQYVVVDDGAPLLTTEAQALWEQALTNASRYLSELLNDPNRDAIFNDVFGRAGTDPSTFQANLQTLYNTLGGSGLRIDVDLRTDAELNGALAAYAAVGHTGTERIYVNGDKLNSGALDLTTTVSGLLEEFAHAMDVRINGNVDSPGDEGQLFASEVTGLVLSADQRALIDAEDDSGLIVIENQSIQIEYAAGSITTSMTNVVLDGNGGASSQLSYTFTIDSIATHGADILVVAYDNSTTGQLIGWQIVNRATSFTANGSYNGIFDFSNANLNKVSSTSSVNIYAWQGSAGSTTGGGTGSDSSPLIVYGNSNITSDGTSANGFRTNNASLPNNANQYVTFGTGTTVSAVTSGQGSFISYKLLTLPSSITIDTLAPTQTSISPASGGTGVLLNAGIVIVYSENIYANGGTVNIQSGSSGTDTFAMTLTAGAKSGSFSAGSGSWAIVGNKLYIKPTNNLAPSTTYNVDISGTALVDAAGYAYSGISSSSSSNNYFTTAASGTDSTAPTKTVSTIALSADNGSSPTDFNTNAASQVITGTLSAALGTDELVQVSIDNGSSWIYANSSGTSFSLAGITLTGSNTIKVRVIDGAGNGGTQKSQSYTFDTTPPATLSLSAPVDSGVSSTDGITKNNSFSVSGFEANASWQFTTDGGSNWSTAQSASTTSFTINDGTYASGSIQVRQIDLAGNIGSTTSSTAAITIDTTVPTNASFATSTSANTAVLISFSEDIFSIATGTINLDDNSASKATWTTSSGSSSGGDRATANAWYDFGSFLYLTRSASYTNSTQLNIDIPGNTFSDAAGNNLAALTSTKNSNIFFTVSAAADTTAPTTTASTAIINSPQNSTATVKSTEAGLAFLVRNSINIAGASTTDAKLDLIAGAADNTWNVVQLKSANVDTSISTAGLTDGVYNFFTLDLAGNLSTSVSNTTTIDTLAPTAPVLTLDSGVSGGATSAEAQAGALTVTGENGAAITVTFTRGATTVTKNLTGTGSAQTVTLTSTEVGNLGDGTINVSATQTDAAGNAQTASATSASFTLDTGVPLAPTLSVVSNVATGGATSAEAQAGALTVTGENGAAITVTFTRGATTVTKNLTGTGSAQTVTLTSTEVGNLGDGTINVSATQTDAAGNAQTASATSASFTLDTGVPLAPTLSVVSNVATGGATSAEAQAGALTVTGENGAAITVTFTRGATTVTKNLTGTGSAQTVTLTSTEVGNLGDGTINVSATQTDAAGNAQTASATSASFTLDTGVPLAPTLSVVSNVATGGATSAEAQAGALTVTGENGAAITVTFTRGATTVTKNLTGTGSAQTVTLTSTEVGNLGDGTINVSATQTDAAGNAQTASATSASFTLDTGVPLAPTLSVVSNVATGGATSAEAQAGALTVTGENGAAITVTFTRGATTVTKNLTGTGSAQTVTLTSTEVGNLGDGTINVSATQTDAAGNAQTASATSASFTLDTSAPAAPTIDVVATDDRVNNIENTVGVTVTGTAEANSSVSISWGITTHTTRANDSGVWGQAFTSTQIPSDGTSSISVTATDPAGNASTAATRSVAIDTQNPTAAVAITAINDDTGTAGDYITSDTSLTVSGTNGTLASDEKVQISTNGSTWFDVTAATSTTWTYTDLTTRSSSLTYQVRVVDTAGNVGNTASKAITIDTAAPTAAVAITAITDDTGTAGDYITSDTSLTVSGTNGTLASDEKVQISTNGSTWSDVTQATATSWSYTDTTRSSNVTYELRVIDVAGNVGNTASRLVVIDTAPPTAAVAITAITDDTGTAGDYITSDTSLTVSGTNGTLASDEKVQISTNGSTWFDVAVLSASTWNYTDPTTRSSSFTYQVRVVDTAGNVGNTASKAITIDIAAPTAAVAITAITDDTGTAGDYITSDTSLTVSGTNGTLASDEKVQISTNGSTWFDVAVLSATTWNYTDPTTRSSSFTYQVRVVDTAGNVGNTASKAITIDIAAPTAAVAITAITDDTGTAGDYITSDTSLTVSGTNGTLASDEKVQISTNGSTWSDVTQATATSWSYTDTTRSSNVTYELRVIDVAGNVGNTASRLVVIDTVAPTTTVSAPTLSSDSGVSASDGITNVAAQTISATLSAALAGALGSASAEQLWASTDNGTTWSNISSSVSGMAVAWSGVNLSGSSTILMQVRDAAGNAGSSASRSYLIDTTSPTGSFSSSIGTNTGLSDTITSGAATRDNTLAFSGDASDSGGSTLDKVEIYLGSTKLGDATLDPNNGTWSFLTAAIPDGSRSFSARLYDKAGNIYTTNTVNATIDTTAAAPTISFAIDDVVPATANVLSGGTTNDNTPTFRLSLSGIGASAGDLLQLFSGNTEWGSPVPLSAINITDNYVNIPTPSNTTLAEGTYTFTARITDQVGNTSAPSAPFTITIDRNPPEVPSFALSNDTGSSSSDGFSTDGTVNVTGLESASSIWQYSTNGGVTWIRGAAVTTQQSSGVTTYVSSFTLGNGSYAAGQVQVRQADLASNLSAVASNAQAIRIDNTAPTIAISSSKPNLGLIDGNPDQRDSATITFVLSEAVTGFTLSDVTVSSSSGIPDGVLSNLQGSGTLYTASFTPSSGLNKAITLSIGSGLYNDLAGNSNSDGSDANNTVSISVNTLPPTASDLPTVVLSLNSGSDSSTKGDWITSSTSQSFSGSLSHGLNSGEILEFSSDNGASWTNITASITNNTSFTVSSNLSGSSTLQARVRTTSASPVLGNAWSRFLTIDTSTWSGALTLGDYSGTISNGSAAGNDDSFVLSLPNAEAGATISYQRYNGTDWVSTDASQSGLGSGTSLYRAVVSDVAGNTATSAVLSVAIDNSAPDAPGLALNNGLSGTTLSKTQLTASNGALLVTTTEAGATVTVTITSNALGSSPVVKTFTSSGGTQSVVLANNDVSVLGDGRLTVTAVITDPAGNSTPATSLQFDYQAQQVTILGDLSIVRTQNGAEDPTTPLPSLFTLTRTGDLSSAATVNYRISGSAVAGVDYVAPTLDANGYGSVTFNTGSSTATLSLSTIDNLVRNSTSRTISVSLIKPDAYNLVTTATTAISTLVDNEVDVVVPEISFQNVFVAEGSSTDLTITANVYLNKATTSTVTVAYQFASGSATLGTDFTGTNGTLTLTFNPGTTRQTISFTIKPDTLIEPDEIFSINLSNALNATLAGNGSSLNGQVTIINDDRLTVTDPSAGINYTLPVGGGNLIGSTLNDNIIGSSASDILNGGLGNDTLNGMSGADVMTGGSGTDRFVYNDFSHSTSASFDSITDFFASSQGDRIAVSALPSKTWFAGTITDATSLSDAITKVAADVDRASSTDPLVALGSGEAVIFRYNEGGLLRTYVMVDDPLNNTSTSSNLFVQVGGLSISNIGTVQTTSIFSTI